MRRSLQRAIWIATSFLVLIGVAVVARRSLQLLAPSPAPPRFPGAADLDKGFDRHPLLTFLHILPGLVFVLLAPWQFVRSLRARHPRLHRWMGRIVMITALIIGVTALVMSPQMAIGGVNETVATMVFGIFFLLALVKAYRAARCRDFVQHREWAIRLFAIGMAVTTTRPIVGAFFATSRITHLTPHDFFGTAFWLGFTLHLIAAESWIVYTRS